MATVPYSGVPSVTQTPASGLPYQTGAGATPEAFGAGIGQAEQGLGRQIEQVGDVLAKHANVLQDRLNEADGNDLFVKWDIEKTKLLTDFQQLEGRQAHDAMPKFLSDQEALRQKYLGQATNTEVKRIFDNNSKRQFGYMVGEAGRYSAGQLRSYENTTAASVVQNAVNGAPNSSSEAQVEESVRHAQSVARTNILSTHGGSEATADEKALEVSSDIYARKIQSLAISDPDEARAFYERHRDDINQKTQYGIEKTLQTADTNVGTKKIANDIVNGRVKDIEPLTPDAGNDWLLKAQLTAKRIAAQDQYKNNPGFELQLENKISSEYNMVKKGQREFERGNLNTLREVINGSTQSPKITSEDAIHSNPALEEVWQQVSKDNPAAIPQLRSLIQKNTKDDVPLTQARVDTFNQIMGMKETDPEGFLMVVPKEKDLTFQQQNQVFTAQRSYKGQIEANSQFNKARTNPLVVEQLGGAEIFPSRTDKAKTEQYNQFMGAYKAELESAAAANNGKYPNSDEQGKIAARLLRQTERPGMFGWHGFGFGSDEPAFKIPDDTRQEIIKNFKARYDGRPPQEQEIYQIYKRLNPSGQ
jgi:hypothetical protein